MIMDELNSVIPSGLKSKTFIKKNKDLFIKVTVEDGADRLRDVLEYKQKSDTFFPTKAFQYTYAVLKCETFVGEEKYELFLEESPKVSAVIDHFYKAYLMKMSHAQWY